MLRRNKKMFVLHLCGCGLRKYPGEGSSSAYPGCVERSHLILGSARMNWHHMNYHQNMRLSLASDYAALVEIAHRGHDGHGVF